MGPVQRTYGGFKTKRKGLPKFILKETFETSGNVFSALHIDNLKMVRGGDNLKLKAKNVTKTTTVREIKPMFDDSFNSTFDKILQPSKDESSNIERINKHIKVQLDNSRQCWTCGRIPETNMAYHALHECKEDSYYLGPDSKAKTYGKRKGKTVKKTIGKKQSKLTLKRSPGCKSRNLKKTSPKKQSPVKPQTCEVECVVVSSSERKSPSKSLNSKLTWLDIEPSMGITSTPNWTRKPKFSLMVSPIPIVFHGSPCNENFSVKSSSEIPSHKELPLKTTDNLDLKPEANNKSDVSELLKCTKSEVFIKEEKKASFAVNSTKMSDNHSVDESCQVIESSVVRQSSFRGPPSGYITKRRVWRRYRKTDFNYSVDMFKSTNNSSVSNQINAVHEMSKVDRLQSNNDKSFHSRKVLRYTQQQFSVSCELKDQGSVAKLMKSERVNGEYNPDRSVVQSLNLDDICNSVRKKLFLNHSSVNELSRDLKSSLCLNAPEQVQEKSVQSRYDSVDMFEDLSQNEMLSKNNTLNHHRGKASLSKNFVEGGQVEGHFSMNNQSVLNSLKNKSVEVSTLSIVRNSTSANVLPDVQLKQSVDKMTNPVDLIMSVENVSDCNQSLKQHLPCRSLSQNSSSSIDESVKENYFVCESMDLVLKPCFVNLSRCDSQYVAHVTFSSQCHKSVVQDISMADVPEVVNNVQDISMADSPEVLNESNESVNCDDKMTAHVETVVKLPLSMLGKFDKISISNTSKMSKRSLESIVHEGKLLEQSAQILCEMEIEANEAKDEVEDIREDVNERNIDDYKEILFRCGQTEPLPFSSCYPESMSPNCKKIGEGAYGEVFLLTREKQKTVIKIIPIEGDIEINGAVQKKFWEIKPEVIVAQELSSLRKSSNGSNCCDIFNEVLAVRCVRGKYPQWMLDLWHVFDEEQGSENDCPDVFDENQLYVALELAHGGQDLESFEFVSADQGVAAIVQIVFALAVGESGIQFEHRDLHWGNVLIAPSKAKTVQFTLEGNKYKVPTKGVKVSVIDFTMSRMTMPKTDENMFYDFGHDEELFAAQGDYQCDIYRLMRERTRNNWSVYEPFTNILWLHYLLDKMCSMVAYRNVTSKIHSQAMLKLENMRDTVLAYPSATAFSASEFFKSSRVR